MVVFNQDLHKSQMKVVQSEIVESKKRVVLDMEEGQDMYDPEFYLSQYQLKNVKDRSMKALCGSYRDVVSCGPGVELVTFGPGCETRDRLAWYCVSPQGEAAWVVDQYRRIEGVEAGPVGPEPITSRDL